MKSSTYALGDEQRLGSLLPLETAADESAGTVWLVTESRPDESAPLPRLLCPECKALRGAVASGKLHREVVNVERGCMTLLTSNDKLVVEKIRAMTSQPVAMR